MVTIRVGALADSGDLYPFIPLIEGKIKPEGFNLEFEIIPTVQDINEAVLKKEVDVSVPSVAMYPYIQDDYYILSNAVATATDGITGMPLLGVKSMSDEEIKKSRLIVHGQNTTAFTLYKLLIGKYHKLIIVRKVLDEIKALGKEGDVLVAVHEIKMMYALKKLGINTVRISSMWDMWKNISNNTPMPMGMVVISKELGKDLAMRFKEIYERSKKYAEAHLDEVIPKDVEIMREAQKADLDEEIVRKTIWADIEEYNVPVDQVRKGLEFFYSITHERGILPKVKSIDLI
ncbi:ABC transporter substrate-binding protein [Sulfolobus sp. A20]|uniref:menaquinone biosynthesis family protein n=1 Tax=Sulfolobaceae TaxID=118883 RepID=UPI000845D551|nr:MULTISPECIES: MqnA/MqnD/SBP family protein [unclassified Sulfolobus]TRM77504.1 ABC transporter substrate-binding protein [Sulfolobus sp. A20-N-F8]TRM82927.1 ABC transporter substrate-binding protein [Sulfolobus sp. A20-N-F6]TRM89433.1 ABC transporter substrate-binding protein [Sulfolobus sp. C3]TRM93020.1 ABC transporter substrate-binding protein [Sulfolobus sp. A20-N-G8]TRN00263.1 ABC transporter substrate-binding protein [Sulfolobus sp. F1]TRN04147.1 ABC transporter substrate-binding pro